MEEDDDFGFVPAGKSRLSSLFPSSTVSEENVNQSLTFVPPKQPKKNAPEGTQPSGRNLQLLLVTAAYTYKLEGGKFITVGKVGVAVLGDKEIAVYKLLLYKGKQQTITMCTITTDFQFDVEPNNYTKFVDDKGDQWSVMFSSETELINFSKQIALARASSGAKVPSKLVVQDLLAGEGNAVGKGDSVDIVYTGWLFKDSGFGEVFDENVKKEKQFIVKLGKSKVIQGMSDGLVGVKKNMRRLLIIPPGIAYGAEGIANLVPPHSTLIFEVFVRKIKIYRDTSESPSPSRKGSEAKPEKPARTQSVNEDSIRSRGASISEQLTQSPRKDNAQLISRMAKMGMPLLPMQGAAAAAQTSSESEPEKEPEAEQPPPSKPSSKSAPASVQENAEMEEVQTQRRRNLSNLSASSPSSTQLQITSMPYPAYTTATYPIESTPFIHQPMQTHALTTMVPPMVVPKYMDSQIPLLVTETRTQNTEVRLALGKISDKVDTILQKVDEARYHQSGPGSTFHGQMPYMEGAILAQNIERIIQENAQLKKDNEAKNSKIQELNEKICDILQRNQSRFFEESNSILERRSDTLHVTTSQLQNQILTTEQEKTKLSSELAEYKSKCSHLEVQSNELQKEIQELKNKLLQENENKEMVTELSSLKEICAASDALIQKLKNDLEEERCLVEKVNQKLNKKDEDLKSAKKSEEELRLKMEKSVEDVKSALLEEAQKELLKEKENCLHYRKKYETLHENARILKEKYESQIISMASEMKKLKASTAAGGQVSQDFTAEIKKIMNVLYKSLRAAFKSEDRYKGSEILETSLGVIQRATLSVIDKKQQSSDIAANKVPEGKPDVRQNIEPKQSAVEPHLESGDVNDDSELKKNLPSVDQVESSEDVVLKTASSKETESSDSVLVEDASEKESNEGESVVVTEDISSRDGSQTGSGEIKVTHINVDIYVDSSSDNAVNVNGSSEKTDNSGDAPQTDQKREAECKTPDKQRNLHRFDDANSSAVNAHSKVLGST